MYLFDKHIHQLALEFKVPVTALKAVIAVESGGKGFDKNTGKIIIQFEPRWFKRKAPYTPSGLWSLNKVERQQQEWKAFNNAFTLNANAAMESTSIGLMQVMGFHYKLLGFTTVGIMWDFAKQSEKNQVWLGLKFIQSNKKLYKAMQLGDWDTFAYYYNGPNYKQYNYHIKLKEAVEAYTFYV